MVVQIHITHITHPSNRVSCSRLEAWDRVFRIFFERARASLVVRGRAFFLFSFFVSNFDFSLAGFSLFVIGDGIRSCALRKNARNVHSSQRPRCLAVPINIIVYDEIHFLTKNLMFWYISEFWFYITSAAEESYCQEELREKEPCRNWARCPPRNYAGSFQPFAVGEEDTSIPGYSSAWTARGLESGKG